MKRRWLWFPLLALFVGCRPQDALLNKDALGVSAKAGQHDDTTTHAALAAKFRSLNRAWDLHCERRINCSSADDFLNCKPYRALVKMGKPALPFIMEAYTRDDYWERDGKLWECVLDDITGLNIVGDRGGWNRDNARDRYLNWWEKERKRSKTD